MKKQRQSQAINLDERHLFALRNVFGFLSYVSMAAASHIIFWYIFELRIYI